MARKIFNVFREHRMLDRQIDRYKTLIRVTEGMLDRCTDESQRVEYQWDIQRYRNEEAMYVMRKNELRLEYQRNHKKGVCVDIPASFDSWLSQRRPRIGSR